MDLENKTVNPDTLAQATDFIKFNMQQAADAFINIGYYLRYIRDNRMYQEAGYIDIWEYGKSEFNLSKSSISRYMAINERFSQFGYSTMISENYKEYGYSKLQELLTMTDEEIVESGITPTTTIAKIRDIKQELKDPEQEEKEAPLPGQMEITDYIPEPKTVATSQRMDRLEIISAFALEWYEKYMDKKQHELINRGMDAELEKYTIEKLIPFEKQQAGYIWHGMFSVGAIEITKENVGITHGLSKNNHSVIVSWHKLVHRIRGLRILLKLPENYTYGGFKIWSHEKKKMVSVEELLIYQMACEAYEELKINKIIISFDINVLTKTLKAYYEPTYIQFDCGEGRYMAEIVEESIIVSRISKNSQQVLERELFEIALEKLVEEIDEIHVTNTNQQCNGNCFYCTTEEECNGKQEKREHCIYDKNRGCGIYKAHELALIQGIDCMSQCCNLCEEICQARCQYSKGESYEEKSPEPEERIGISAILKEAAGEKNEQHDYSVKAIEKEIIEEIVEDEEPEEETVQAEIITEDEDSQYELQLEVYLKGYGKYRKDEDGSRIDECLHKIVNQLSKQKYTVKTPEAEEFIRDFERYSKESIRLYKRNLAQTITKSSDTEQIPLPTMKNNDQRKEFINNYRNWPLWYENPLMEERAYKYQLEDGSSLLMIERLHVGGYYDYKSGHYVNKEKGYNIRDEYILVPGKTVHSCRSSTSAMIEKLKEIQK